MKTFKKAISLVLVFAMLASFAGMTGYKYSPMSIEAEAAMSSVGTKKLHYLDGGATINVADVLYKSNNSAHNLRYRENPATTNQVKPVKDGYYTVGVGIPGNDLSFNIKTPEGTTYWKFSFSLDKTTHMAGFDSDATAISGYDRGADSTETDEYGVVLGSRLDTPEKMGFRDVDKVYYILNYTVDGTDYYDYVEVKLIDYAKKDDVDIKEWTQPAKTSAPQDSQAGSKYKLDSWSVPSTLYKDSSGYILYYTDGTTDGKNGGDKLNVNIQFDLPAGIKSIAYYLSTDGSNWKCYFSGAYSPSTSDGVTYNESGLYNDEYSSGNGKIKVTGSALYYKLEYAADVTLPNGKTQEVTFVQYAASYVQGLPDYKSGMQSDYWNDRSNSAGQAFALIELMNYKNVIASNGINLYSSYRNSSQTIPHTSDTTPPWSVGKIDTNYTNGMSLHNKNVGTIVFFNYYKQNRGEDKWAINVYNEDTDSSIDYDLDSSITVGTSIFYDPEVVKSAINVDYQIDFYESKGGREDKSTSLETYWGGWAICNSNTYEYYKKDWVNYSWNAISGGAANSYDRKTGNNGGTYSGINNFSLSGITDKDIYSGDWSSTFQIDFSNANFATKKNLIFTRFLETNNTSGSWATRANICATTGIHLEIIPVSRSNAHSFINEAIANNYVEAEMDSTWWSTYKQRVFDAYLACGKLDGGSDIASDSVSSIINKPKYVFAKYNDIRVQLKTVAEWDRGGATTDGTNAVTDGLSWGTGYAKYNATTYNSGVTGRSPQAGAVENSLAAYDLKFNKTTKELYISDEIRTGEYYYTAASWQAYEDARFAAMNAYNYPTKAPKTAADYAAKQEGHDYDEVKFDYDATYPEKEASTTASNGAGLACYCKAEIDTATVALEAARAGLKKKGENGNTEYDHVDDAYQYLISATSSAVYDGVDDLRAYVYNYTDPVTGETETRPIKHGLAGIYDSTINPDNNNGNQHNYQVASLMFRANHEKDVFNYIFTEEQAALWNERNPDKPVSSGAVRTDEDGNPLVLIDKGTDLVDYIDDTVELASNVEGNTYYDAGILSFPKVDGSRGPVGRGNTFTQLAFDNSAYSTNAVDKMRTAIGNRINWGKGGYNEYYPYLGMVEGAYKGDANGKDENGNPVTKMTEEDLINNPGNWTWKEIEHRDDILRAAYALTLVAPTIRLATSYREVEEILNNQDNDKNRGDEILVPPYDIGGSVYNDKQLWKVTIFHDYDGSYDTEDDAFEYNNRTYNTTGKTWYTEESWNTFAAARDELAKLIFNGSVTGGISDNIVNQYNVNEIEQNFVYQSMLGQTHYTYDQYYDLTGQKIITRVAPKDSDTEGIKNFVGYYTNGHYANQQEINEDSISNLAAAENGQAKVNEYVDAYYAAMKALKLKKLDEYDWAYGDGETYPVVGELVDGEYTEGSIKWKVNAMLTELKKEQNVVDFKTLREDPEDSTKITGAELITGEKKISYYNTTEEPYKTAYNEAVAAADYILAVIASTPNFNGTDNLGDKVSDLDARLDTLKTNYDIVVGNGQYMDDSAWDGIIDHLNELAGVLGTDNEITRGQLAAKFRVFYNDRKFDADGDESTDEVFISAEITDAVADFDKVNSAADKQKAINDAVERLYNALNNTATAYDIAQIVGIEKDPTSGETVSPAIGTVLSYPKEYMFKVYNYTSTSRAGTHLERSRFTDDSIAILETQARAYRDHEYPMLSTYTSEIDEHELAASNLKKLESEGGVLVEMGAVITYLESAISYAESQLYDVVDGEKVVKTTTATSPEGTTYPVPNFTEESIAQLEAILAEAQDAIDSKLTYVDQLTIDKLTWFVYEETTDNTQYLLVGDTAGLELLYHDIYTWETVDGKLARKENSSWNSYYDMLLYGNRQNEEYQGMTGYGLQAGPAYYGFLEEEIKGNTIIKTVTNEETGETTTIVDDTYIGTVWNADGSLIFNDNGTSVGDRIFKNWSSYMEHYNNAVALVNAKDKTVNEQESVVDDAAKKLYNARNALELMNLYFPNNTEAFETAKGWYNELSAYVQKTDVTRYGWEYVDVTEEVTDETTGEVTTVTTTVFQKSENPLSSVTQSVYIYNGVTPEIEADIDEFRAKYASENSTEVYDSLAAAENLYNDIKAALTDPETEALYTVKKTNDESLIAGMLDLTGRIDPETQELVGGYLAGTWTVTFDEETGASTGVYATDLLNSTQAGLLQTYLTNAQNKINSKEDATAGFGGALGALTTIVFDETKKPATDLQFAVHMRDNELFAFLDYTYTNNPDLGGQLVNYYYQDGMYTYRLIRENIATEIKGQVNDYFGDPKNWPKIYEIQGTTWNRADAEVPDSGIDAVVDGYNDHYVDEDGNPGESWGEYKGANEKICEILDLVASRAYNYSDALARGVMPFEVAHYTWLVDNAFTEVGGIDYVLADASAVSAANEAPFNYDVSVNNTNIATGNPGWYTAGYGVKDVADGKYYLYYNDAEGAATPSWFTEDSRRALDSALDLSEFANYGINDLDEEGNVVSFSSLDKLAVYTPATYFFTTYGVNLTDIATIPEAGKYPHELYGYYSGYNDIKMQIDSSLITVQHNAIDTIANNAYNALHDLTLLPATEAYRDVYNTYLSIKGQHIDDGNWNGDSYSSATTISNVDFTFYNLLNTTQLSRIAGMYSELNYDAAPPYGTVLRASYSGFLDKYTQSGEYADQENNPWYSMETYITNFIDAGATITIDQAAQVNTYDKTDNITSIMETLVDEYLSNLEFDDLVYDNLDEVVKAFLGDNLSNGLAAVKTTLQNMGFTVGGNYEGQFYPLSYYTDDSLLQVAGILRSQNVLADGKIIEKIINTDTYKWIGDTFPLPIVFNSDYKGSFYTSTTDQNKIDSSKPEDNSVLLAFLTALNTQLVLKGVDTEKLVEQITLGDAIVPQKYDTTQQAWAEYEDALADAKDYRDRAGEYDIRDQVSVIDAATSRLAAAIEALKEIVLADNYAPSMTLKTSVAAVDEFYSKEAYEVALREADSASFTATGEGNNVTYTANPAAGTFFVPNNSGYSLIVYTNELDPRIVINLEDLEQKLADGSNGSADVMQDAAKKEYISINAVKTSGVTANVIAGTIVPAHNNIAEKLTVEKALAATANQAVEVTNSSEVKGSSAFAILAPRFVEGKATQAAVYTIQARDGSERNVDGGTVYGNSVKQLEFGGAGQEPVDIKVLDSNNNIAIYIYYYSLKAADGRDEGINAAGTALAAPAIEGTNVPNILLSGEPGFKGVNWRNGVLLQRSFSSSHRVWEYVSEIKKNDKNQYNVNGTQVPVYNDPTFGQLNTGSFYYVLDEKVEADAEVIEAYNSENNSVAGCMDYDRATVAKEMMISKINEKDSTVFAEMKASGRFYNYGDYETDEFGNVLYNGDEPKWINWAQAIGGKVENGDLVFVHVVDRWGNVVNRIIEITNLDENAPEVSSDEAGAVTIDETGGSGLADIQVHNGDFSLGEFKYEVSQSQNVIKLEGAITNKAEVNCASNVLTIVNLVPGKTYLIGAEDKAGNRSTTAVKADAEGHIVLTIDNKIVQTGEDMGLEGNSSAFTLNGTDTIILNSGEESSVINAKLEGNVFANRTIRHYITTKDNVEALKTVYQDGTVEEFTAENATVKDNGDGTLVWTIKRKLAEGEHKYDVYAKVNGKYETYYAVAVINATTRTVKIECTNVGQGATELKFSGSLSFDIANYISKEVPYGAQVTITAKAYTTYEGCEFYYWINNTTDRIINTADVYEFKAVANADYIAQFTNNSTCIDGKKFVVYVNNAKNVIDRFELAEGDDYAVPSGPVLPDYTFKGWSMTKAEVLASEKATVIVEPIYELNASYTVSIAQGSYTATGAGTYTAEANQRAVVTISTSAKDGEGKDFLYWIDADTDEIVSYDRTYSFFCVKDTELAPVYGDASTVKAEPIVRITEVKFNAFSGKASFFAERSVPEEYTILQTGIVVTKTETIGTNEEVFVVGGTSTAAGTSTSTANNGYYSASTSVATGQTVWARAYVIYETADGEILEVYGPVVSYTVD
ncbi:MAG: hypothetical protein IJN38_00680 [Clostridia bacterium]|nr:hypothetical protein [Clostridia bacterium]